MMSLTLDGEGRALEREMDREDEEDRRHARAQAERDLQELLEKRGIAPLMGRLGLLSELPPWAEDANYGTDEDYHRALVVWTLREEKGRFRSAFRLNFRAPLAGHGRHLSALDGIVGH